MPKKPVGLFYRPPLQERGEVEGEGYETEGKPPADPGKTSGDSSPLKRRTPILKQENEFD